MRPILILLLLVPVTVLLGPVQLLFVALNLRWAALLPIHYHRFVCRLLDIRLTIEGQLAPHRPLLITANHSSWLDIPVLSAVGPVSFIAKSEIAGWPIFGWLAKLQRSIFIDRSRRAATGAVNKRIADRLAQGDVMVLFAEGTSSDGNRILPFRTALIGAAREAAAAGGATVYVQPLSVAYVSVWGVPLGRLWRPRVAWYGDVDLAPHLWSFLKRGGVDVKVTIGEPIPFSSAADRKQVARDLEGFVRAATVSALTGRPSEAALPPSWKRGETSAIVPPS